MIIMVISKFKLIYLIFDWILRLKDWKDSNNSNQLICTMSLTA